MARKPRTDATTNPDLADSSPSLRRPTGRAAELGLLILVAIIVTSALALVELNQNRELSIALLWYGLAFLTVFGVAHMIIRAIARYADPLILPLVALLNGLGLVMIHRLDLADAAQAKRDATDAPTPLAPTQLMWTGVALVLFLVVLLLVKHHATLQRYTYTLALGSLLFLAIPAALPAKYSEVNGAKIWIKIPGAFSIQPAEFAKIGLIVFAAAYLVAKRTVLSTAGKRLLGLVLPRARDLGPLLIAMGVTLGVLFVSKDLGTALLLFVVFLVMIYMATGRVSWMIIGLLGFAAGAYFAYLNFAHLRLRVNIWLHPFDDPSGASYQLVQSLFSLGTGGIFGTGLGAGRPDLVPVASTDFITAALGEEIGLVGLTAILLCYLLLASRGLRAGLASKDNFGKLLAAGLSFSMIFQVFVVVGGVTRLIPLTGLTTPFMSYGGSSLLANYMLMALLVRVSHASRRPSVKTAPPPEPLNEAMTAMVALDDVRAAEVAAGHRPGPNTPPQGALG